jgi:hypothetical protein
VHVLTLLGGDAVGTTVSILILKDPFHVEASGVAGLMGVSYQMPDPAKRQRSIARLLRFVRKYVSADL